MFKTPLVTLTLVCFLFNSVSGPFLQQARADEFHLPLPGIMVHLSPDFNPPTLKGIKVHLDDPFRFDFILDKGDSELSTEKLKDESSKLIKYFLASLTIPEKDLWVNLSPYEKDRIIPNSFGLTEMGRDLLGEDYMLKQITASLIYPEDRIGKKFWKRIYEEAQKKYGTTNIPVNTFNKVWIIPEKAIVYENAQAGTAYVVESKLKVMLEQDYLSLEKHAGIQTGSAEARNTSQLGNQIVREIIIPELTTEINENKNFARLRQVYNSLILATWYKKKIKDSILSQVYADKNKVSGVNVNDPKEKDKIYLQYLRAFKKGVYNYIKEDVDPMTQEMIPRKYFSGGMALGATYLKPVMKIITLKTAGPSFFKFLSTTAKLMTVMATLSMGGVALSQTNAEEAIPQAHITTVNNLEKYNGEKSQNLFGKIESSSIADLFKQIDDKTSLSDQKLKAAEELANKAIKQLYGQSMESKSMEEKAKLLYQALIGYLKDNLDEVIPQAGGYRGSVVENWLETHAKEQKITPENLKFMVETTVYLQGLITDRIKSFTSDLTNSQKIGVSTDPLAIQDFGNLLLNDGRMLPSNYPISRILEILQNNPRFKNFIQIDDKNITITINGRIAVIDKEKLLGKVTIETPASAKVFLGFLVGLGIVILFDEKAQRQERKRLKKETAAPTNRPETLTFTPTAKLNSFEQAQRQYNLLNLAIEEYKNDWANGSKLRSFEIKEREIWRNETEGSLDNADGLIKQLRAEKFDEYIIAQLKESIDELETKLEPLNKNIPTLKEKSMETVTRQKLRAARVITQYKERWLNPSFLSLEMNNRDQWMREAQAESENIDELIKELKRSIKVEINPVKYQNAIKELQTLKDTLEELWHPIDNERIDRLLIERGKKVELESIIEKPEKIQEIQSVLFNAKTIADQIFSQASLEAQALFTKEVLEVSKSMRFELGHQTTTERKGDGLQALSFNKWKDDPNKYLERLNDYKNRLTNPIKQADRLRRIASNTGAGFVKIYDNLLYSNHVEAVDLPQRRSDEFAETEVNFSSIRRVTRTIIESFLSVPKFVSLAFNSDQLQKESSFLNSLSTRPILRADRAMTSAKYGGIDLTPANMNLLTQNAGTEIKFHLDPAMLQRLQNAPGFTPVIINIQPLISLPQFLGINITKKLTAET